MRKGSVPGFNVDEAIVMTTRGRSTYRMTSSRWVVMFLVIMLVSSAAIALVGTLLAAK
jgi:hypothetical protein